MKQSVFLDSSVVLAACGSATGASHRLLYYGHVGLLKVFISQIVFLECQRKIYKFKHDEEYLLEILAWSRAHVLPAPHKEELAVFANLTNDQNDVHLFASCSKIINPNLISLDKKHILNLENQVSNFSIFSPAEFLKVFLC